MTAYKGEPAEQENYGKDLVKQIRDIQERLERLEEAHLPSAKSKTKTEFTSKKLTRIFGDDIKAGVTPEDPELFENLIVMGFKTDIFLTVNASDGEDFAFIDEVIEIPRGTTQVLAFLRGWYLGFGKTSSDGVTIESDGDHHYGIGYARVTVLDVGDTIATIRGELILRDKNGDDRWTGGINAVVIYLGPHP